MAEQRVFVYGTLRRGLRLAHLLAEADYVETLQLDGYELYDLGRYPGAVRGNGTVTGEIYSFQHPAVLRGLDRAEGALSNPPLFTREQLADVAVPTWIYLYAADLSGRLRIPSGDWFAR